jgi:hypothetical protein
MLVFGWMGAYDKTSVYSILYWHQPASFTYACLRWE